MSIIIAETEQGYRRICMRCDGTGIDPDSPGGADPCFACEDGIEEIEYDEDEYGDY